MRPHLDCGHAPTFLKLLRSFCASVLFGTTLATAQDAHSTYLLGPDDQILTRSLHAQEINEKQTRVDQQGFIRLPMLGQLKAAGLNTTELEQQISIQLQRFYREADVAVTISEYRSQPVSVVGAVKNAGMFQLQGKKNLLEIFALAGGAEPDSAHKLTITRQREWGMPPLPGAHLDESGAYYTAQVAIPLLLQGTDPSLNIEMAPRDVVTVPRAQLVYVLGEVIKAGGFPIRDGESVSVLQALSFSGGFSRMAGPKNARVLRVQGDRGEREEIAVNLKKVMDGEAEDFQMQPSDILYIPNSLPKSVGFRALEAAVQAGTGIAIWRTW